MTIMTTSPTPAIGPRTDRTRIRRHPERAVPDRIEEILRTGLVAHVAYVDADGGPRIVPFLYHYVPGRIILHGRPASQTLGRIRGGARVAVSVTVLHDLVASRDAENHSANYGSVVAFGTGRQIRNLDEKRLLLQEMTARYFPGRTVGREYAEATEEQLRSLEVIEVVIEEASGKARSGPPLGPRDADPDAPGDAGLYAPDGLTRR